MKKTTKPTAVKKENAFSGVTEKQASYADALAREKGYRDYHAAYKGYKGKSKIGAIRRQEMSDLIAWLKA